MPEGTLGWWYYTDILMSTPERYAKDPVTACTMTAMNHMGTKLVAMRPAPYRPYAFDCKYPHFMRIAGAQWYTSTVLRCKWGYTPRWPGVCTKLAEQPAPVSCSPGQPGNAVGDPVQIASGDRVQRETDLVAGPGDLLRVDRFYRALRADGKGQSAGFNWSFSFDRAFDGRYGPIDHDTVDIEGSLADGSFFRFHREPDGSYRSLNDQGFTLSTTGDADWLLTTPAGTIERYAKVGDAFRLVRIQTRAGQSASYEYDGDGHLARISDAGGRAVEVKWAGDQVASIAGGGASVSYEYEQASDPEQADIEGMARLVGVRFHDAAGLAIASRRYHYEDPRQRFLLTGITDEKGVRFATYAYNDAGQSVSTELADGAERYTFAYPDDKTRVITDPLGTARTLGIVYTDDHRWRIAAESQAAGAGCGAGASASTYSYTGNLESSTDFNGLKTCFTNDGARGLELRRSSGFAAAETCPASTAPVPNRPLRHITTSWHPDWPLATGVAQPNRVETTVYNGQPGPDGAILRCAGEAVLLNNKPLAVPCLRTVQATSDGSGALGMAAARTGPAMSWQYTYDADGRLLTRSGPPDAGGNVDRLTLVYYADSTATHAIGDLASVANGAGETTRYLEYGRDGAPTLIRRPNGQTVSLEYGARQRLVASTVADAGGLAETTRYAYDAPGQLESLVGPDGVAVSYMYDAAHRLTGVRDGAGNVLQLTLDAMGNAVRQEYKGAGGEVVARAWRSYDALNRLEREQRGESDPGTRFGYDKNGNATTSIDPMGRTILRSYDVYNQLLQEKLPAPTPSSPPTFIGYAYNNLGQLVRVTDPRWLATSYNVDGLDRRTAVISPDTGTTTTMFDNAGLPVSRTDAAGRTTAYRFDAAGRVAQIGRSTFEYGANDTGAAGRLTRMLDPAARSDYAYDGFGRLLSKAQMVTGGPAKVRFETVYGYGVAGNAAGHVTSLTYPSGSRLEIAYGSDGRASGLSLTRVGAAPLAILGEIVYQPFGPARSWLWGNSTPAGANRYERQFDAQNRLVGYPLGHPANNGAVRQLVYDAGGRITATLHTGGPDAARLNQSFTYDDLDRLVGFDAVGTRQQFQYDANGNRTSATFGATTYANTIAADSNRLSATSGPPPAGRNVYDAAGNLTSDGVVSYTYGENGRLSAVTGGGAPVDYIYNGLGERIAKQGPGKTATYYVYDEAGHLLGEYDTGGKPIQETVYLDGVPVAVIVPAGAERGASAGVYYVYADHLGAPRVLTRATDNTMVWRWDGANPFGEDPPDENPGRAGRFTYNPRFPGQVFDKETNHHYNYYRDYDPRTGRYVQSDPIGLAGGISTYAYVGGNPLSYFDPYGLRNVDVYIWRAEGSSVGHVMVAEANSTQVILSQFPSNGYPLGPNETKSFAATMAAEGRAASEIWRINVPDDKAFDAAAARERGLKRWSWNPSNDSTQCSIAASRALKAGGVGLNTITTGTLMPGFFANGLGVTPGIGYRLPQVNIRKGD